MKFRFLCRQLLPIRSAASGLEAARSKALSKPRQGSVTRVGAEGVLQKMLAVVPSRLCRSPSPELPPDLGLSPKLREFAARGWQHLLRGGKPIPNNLRSGPVTRYKQRRLAAIYVGLRLRGSIQAAMMQHILKQEAGLQEACSSCDERAKFTASSAAALLGFATTSRSQGQCVFHRSYRRPLRLRMRPYICIVDPLFSRALYSWGPTTSIYAVPAPTCTVAVSRGAILSKQRFYTGLMRVDFCL